MRQSLLMKLGIKSMRIDEIVASSIPCVPIILLLIIIIIIGGTHWNATEEEEEIHCSQCSRTL